MVSVLSKGFIYNSALLLVQSLFCTYIAIVPGSEASNDCYVNGSPTIVEVNETIFNMKVHNIVADESSGMKTHCKNLYIKAGRLTNLITTNYPMVSSFRHSRTYSISCNLTQGMGRSEIIECLRSTYEVLKNFSISISVMTRTSFIFQRQNIGNQLQYLSELRNNIDSALCSIEVSRVVNLNSANVQIGPLDFIGNINHSLTQFMVVVKIYNLANAIKNTCSESAVPATLSQLLLPR